MQETISLTISQAQSPLVYTHSRNGVVLYVGHSKTGLHRAISPPGHDFQDVDEIRVTICDTPEQAKIFERALIRVLQPARNVYGVKKVKRTRIAP